MHQPVMVAYGGGVNSTALLIGCVEKGIHIDAILFADTGARDGLGEKPPTYWFIWKFCGWLLEHGLPPITIVMKNSRYDSLEDNCLQRSTLPSKAFGGSSCSDKWKQHPQNYWANHWEPARQCWDSGQRVIKLMGIDAGEAHRATITEDAKYLYRYPLVDWNWGREECVEAIERAGLPTPPKSACPFCPSSKKREVLQLAKEWPDLFARAVAMERKARDAGNLDVVKGLGRNWSWEELVKADTAQLRLLPDPPAVSCICFDGDTD